MNKPTFKFNFSQKLRLAAALDEIEYDQFGNCGYVNSLRKLAYYSLPDELIDILHTQKTSKEPLPYIWFENVPCDYEVIKVPYSQAFREKCKSGYRSENFLVMISSILGEPYSMVFEGAELVNNLVPLQETKKDYTGLGSEVELDFHIENAALKHFPECNFSPMGLMLSGVHFDPKGPLTRIADGRAALNRLDDKTKALLSEKNYKIKVPHRWRDAQLGINVDTTDWVPILLETGKGYPEISAAFYKDMIETKDETSRQALDSLHCAVRDVSFGIAIKPGQSVYIDNRFAFHSRDKFTPSYSVDGRALRWLQRVFVAPNLWGHRSLSKVDNRIYKVAS